MSRYEPARIEPRWQRYWQEHGTFRSEVDAAKPKYYVLDMFPYPSGAGLHVGHPEGYTATDILARYKRMRGFNVLHPMGWDSFGLPAEQYALDHHTHPAPITAKNIATFKGQLTRLGFSYDWDRELATSAPDYYRWTQWIFLKLFNRGLAYEAEVPVNWCPALGTVLANEEVIDGKSERGGHPVVRRPMKQWMLRITAYADRLLEDLEALDWPESLKEMQRNWIGRSEGAQLRFAIQDRDDLAFEVFTTRPDTLFGATYAVLAPEHLLVDAITTDAQRAAVEAYRQAAATKSDLERTELAKEKTGVFTGAHAINPANGALLPIWIADYVLATYGTGAIMAVPGHDERDWEFATRMQLPIKAVVRPADVGPDRIGAFIASIEREAAFTEPGVAFNSDHLDGKPTLEAKRAMTAWLETRGLGKKQVNYRLRDWLFSRQRYWGEPIPVLHLEDGTIKALREEDLPLLLPDVPEIRPSGTGESPLAAIAEWVNTTDPETGKPARRETNTMPQWAGSCWYYLRYLDPKNDRAPWDPAAERYWGPVDLYVGGTEHAVLHLLYARFWHKVLYDEGLVSTKEPFQRLVNQGMILGENGEKMSKSRGNVINPDDIVAEYGADTLRLYEMFMGPLEATKPWSTKGVEGCFRFLQRVWRRLVDEAGALPLAASAGAEHEAARRLLHKSIKKVTGDIEGLRFNTAISQLMIYTNELYKTDGALPRELVEPFVLLLAPFAPHAAEELWQLLGHDRSIAHEAWPQHDEALARDEEVELAVQVNGKIRGKIVVAVEAPQDEILRLAKADTGVSEALAGKAVVKEIVVPGRLVNLVVK